MCARSKCDDDAQNEKSRRGVKDVLQKQRARRFRFVVARERGDEVFPIEREKKGDFQKKSKKRDSLEELFVCRSDFEMVSSSLCLRLNFRPESCCFLEIL